MYMYVIYWKINLKTNNTSEHNCFLQFSVESSLSVATSLKSENNLLPDDNVYSRYDDAIAGIDNDLQTAVSQQEAKEGKRASSAVSVWQDLTSEYN